VRYEWLVQSAITNVECVVITALAVAFALTLLRRKLERTRPGLHVARPLAVGYVLRLVVIAGVSLTGIGKTLRGGDEITFMTDAHRIAASPWTSSAWLPWDHSSYLHIIVFAIQLKLLGSPEGAIRITQVGIALAGVLLIVAAVYDLAGAANARLAAWLLSLEVASLFFNELIHKDPLMELASGLVVFGGAKVWRKLEPGGVALMAAGGLIALGTRHYVGWFLLACAILVSLHAALRQSGGGIRSLGVIYGAAAVILVAAPAILAASTPQSLQRNLQSAQNANATATKGNGSTNGNNLALEQVNFSSRGAIITNLPLRIRDVLLRPYPWQLGDVSQGLGLAGSLVALTCFALMIRFGWICRGQIMKRAGPLLYPFLFLTVAYALSVGNAGTGFRYRTHLVTLGLAAMVVLRQGALEIRASESERTELGSARGRTLAAVQGAA